MSLILPTEKLNGNKVPLNTKETIMISKKSLLLVVLFFGFGLADFVTAERSESRITDVIYKNDQSSNKDKKEKLKSLRSSKQSIQLTFGDMEDINSIFQNYSDSLNEKTSTSELFEIISARGVAIISPDDCSPEYFEQRQKVFENYEQLVSKARKLLASQGDVLIDQLVVKIQDSLTTDYVANAIKILAEIGSPKAKQTLLDIIDLKIEDWGAWDSQGALHCYLQIIGINEAKEFLSSRGDNVLEETVRQFPELAKEPAVFNRMCNFLQSNNLSKRLWVIGTFMYFPPEKKVSERVSAIAESLKTVHQMPNSNDRYSHTSLGTQSDFLYGELCRVLSSMSNAESDLAKITNELDGLARKWVTVTRAYQGDVSLKEEVVSILKDQAVLERTSLRLVAVSALGVIGTQNDIAFLKDIEKNDPLNYLNRGGILLERIYDMPINNTGERAVLVYEEIIDYDPWKEHEDRKCYPIRDEASRAIIALQEKI